MTIQTERLILRPFTVKDTYEYYSLVSTSTSIRKFVPYASAKSPNDMRETITKSYSKGNFKDDFYFVLEEKATHKIVGAILAVRLVKGELDVSYLIGEDFRNRGYMYEAMVAFKNALNSTNIKYLIFVIDIENVVSKKLIQKLGGKCIGFESKNKGYLHYCLDV